MIVLSSATEEAGRILADAHAFAGTQVGGTLATMHAEDGTPYLTYVLFHMRLNGELIFGSMTEAHHARNLDATPECSFLIDNREIIGSADEDFWRIVIEGRATRIAWNDRPYATLLEELRAKSTAAAAFAESGRLYRIAPRRVISMRGYESGRHIIEFDAD